MSSSFTRWLAHWDEVEIIRQINCGIIYHPHSSYPGKGSLAPFPPGGIILQFNRMACTWSGISFIRHRQTGSYVALNYWSAHRYSSPVCPDTHLTDIKGFANSLQMACYQIVVAIFQKQQPKPRINPLSRWLCPIILWTQCWEITGSQRRGREKGGVVKTSSFSLLQINDWACRMLGNCPAFEGTENATQLSEWSNGFTV